MGAPAAHQVANAVLVQVAGDHDLGVGEAGLVQNAADLARELSGNRRYPGGHPRAGLASLRGAARAFDGIVGIDELHGGFAQQALQLAEGLGLAGRTTSPRSAPPCPSRGCRSGIRRACCWCRRSLRYRRRARPARRPRECARGACRIPRLARPPAASTQRAALVAIRDWNDSAESRYVSGICASMMGRAQGEHGLAGEQRRCLRGRRTGRR